MPFSDDLRLLLILLFPEEDRLVVVCVAVSLASGHEFRVRAIGGTVPRGE